MKDIKHVKDGWFFETCPMWPGMALSLEIENVLYDEKSPFQHIQVFETK
ncbi:MAG: spermidine synthase, partial [Candidatus Moranbacteria bacterium]|nr:spermidine synthase [Candidatus Moranbacteria bacterium]